VTFSMLHTGEEVPLYIDDLLNRVWFFKLLVKNRVYNFSPISFFLLQSLLSYSGHFKQIWLSVIKMQFQAKINRVYKLWFVIVICDIQGYCFKSQWNTPSQIQEEYSTSCRNVIHTVSVRFILKKQLVIAYSHHMLINSQ